MVKKVQKSTASAATAGASPLSGAIKDSAQQIWLAGLGAFSKAQAEGGKAFETLVKEGLSIQRKTQSVAEERINEATSRMSNMANEIGSKAAGQWDKLENIFEDRVAKALGKLGVPSARDIETLMERIDALTQQVHQLHPGMAAVKAASKPAARKALAKKVTEAATKTAAKTEVKAAAKKPAARKTTSRAKAA
ncbi:MAG: phasin family protein [Hydrogenophaga sp.]|uniref:phasin family protein n=1 Tax=Hydrogenophaga sp. TaxID=1904254 RepID=UPI003D9B341A